MTQIELTRFRIKKGKEKKAQEWMNFLNEHHVDTVKTMAAEKMYVETVFSEKNKDGYTYFTGILSKARMVRMLKNQKAI